MATLAEPGATGRSARRFWHDDRLVNGNFGTTSLVDNDDHLPGAGHRGRLFAELAAELRQGVEVAD
jgi:hypothetical protein